MANMVSDVYCGRVQRRTTWQSGFKQSGLEAPLLRIVKLIHKMRDFKMFITAVCLIFLTLHLDLFILLKIQTVIKFHSLIMGSQTGPF